MASTDRQFYIYKPERILEKSQEWPIGSRWSLTNEPDSDYRLTVVAFDCELEEPLFLADDFKHGHEFTTLSEEVGDDPDSAKEQADAGALTRAANDSALAERACAAARGLGVRHFTVWATPATLEQLLAAHEAYEANEAMITATKAARRAEQERNERIAAVVGQCGGNQSAAARLLGIDQSRISRAISSLPVVP
jgi:hypothetical protein